MQYVAPSATFFSEGHHRSAHTRHQSLSIVGDIAFVKAQGSSLLYYASRGAQQSIERGPQ